MNRVRRIAALLCRFTYDSVADDLAHFFSCFQAFWICYMYMGIWSGSDLHTSVLVFCFNNNNNSTSCRRDCMSSFCALVLCSVFVNIFHSLLLTLIWSFHIPCWDKWIEQNAFSYLPFPPVRTKWETSCLSQLAHCAASEKQSQLWRIHSSPFLCAHVISFSAFTRSRFNRYCQPQFRPFIFAHHARILCARYVFSRRAAFSKACIRCNFSFSSLDESTWKHCRSICRPYRCAECLKTDAFQKIRFHLEIGWF